jgi:hypothetical protein
MKNLTTLLPDALMIGGAAALSYGVWLAYPPAGFAVGGLLSIAAGVLTARVAK